MRGRRTAALVVLFGAVFAGGFALSSAPGHGSAPPPLIVVDQSIGGVAIGMTQAQVEAEYGAPDESQPTTSRGDGTGLLVTYHVEGGDLIIGYDHGRVVSIETSSTSFRTGGGVGPGSTAGGVGGFRQDFCSGGLWNGSADTQPDGAVTVFALAGDDVFSVTITLFGYYDACESAPTDQEVPDPRPGSVLLSVQISPNGGGWVRSTPYRIDCPTACERSFARDSTVTLVATPTGGFTFEGWSGACAGTGPCTLTMDDAKSVTARFSGTFGPTPPTPTRETSTTTETTTGTTTTETTTTETTTE
jgi:uncharacterized repeat protein (TIGR02543 family)